jgi:hypothetical protein
MLSVAETMAPTADERRTVPGKRKNDTSMIETRTLPAKTAVRPAVFAASDAACRGAIPSASASLKRVMIRSEWSTPSARPTPEARLSEIASSGGEVENDREHAEGGEDRPLSHDQRNCRGHRRAEHEQEDDDEDGRRDQLGLVGAVRGRLVELLADRSLA